MPTKEELERELELANEKLYEAGLKKRDTMISRIEAREEQAHKTIEYIIEECEKETGRPLVVIHNIRAGLTCQHLGVCYPYCED